MDVTRILLVEDNRDDEFLVCRALRRMGFLEVSVARDGQEALDQLLGDGIVASGMPAFVLLDLKLPRADGTEIMRRLRADLRTQQLPVFVLTSSEDPQDQKACNELGALEFLSKPLVAESFLKALEKHLPGLCPRPETPITRH